MQMKFITRLTMASFSSGLDSVGIRRSVWPGDRLVVVDIKKVERAGIALDNLKHLAH